MLPSLQFENPPPLNDFLNEKNENLDAKMKNGEVQHQEWLTALANLIQQSPRDYWRNANGESPRVGGFIDFAFFDKKTPLQALIDHKENNEKEQELHAAKFNVNYARDQQKRINDEAAVRKWKREQGLE